MVMDQHWLDFGNDLYCLSKLACVYSRKYVPKPNFHFLSFLNTEMAPLVDSIPKKASSTFIAHRKYHNCWWSGDARTSHAIDLFRQEYSCLRSREFLAATKQLNEWYFLSVRPSLTPFSLCSHHRIIMKFSGFITNDQGRVHAKGQGQRSKVKVTEVTAQLNRFRTVTPVWIHIWWWNDAYSYRRGALLFFKVIRQISRSHGYKNRRIWPRLGVSGL